MARENLNKQSMSETRKKIISLENQIKQLSDENTILKQKQDQTNGSIGDYITEMTTMLTQAEIDSAMNMENYDSMEEDEYANDQQMIDEIDLEEDYRVVQNRPHAGTGGSSKLRSRPHQQSNAT